MLCKTLARQRRQAITPKNEVKDMNFFDRFTEGAQKALRSAQEHARALGHNYVGTEHLLLGLLAVTESQAAKILHSVNIDTRRVVERIEKIIGRGEYKFDESFDFTPRSKKTIELSIHEAKNGGHNYVGTEHLLLALIREQDSVAVRILMQLGAHLPTIEEAVATGAGKEKGEAAKGRRASAKVDTPTLDQFGRDLTKMAKDGELDPVIGRNVEIERIVQILSRRTKNNPVLIGDPGVGKSAVAEGLAQCIVDGTIPEILKDRRVITLDMAGMVAGTKYRGEFEERVKTALDEIRKAGNVILFIDELHTIIGAGATEGALDAANILKPALARGEIQVIGATTIDEYRKHIEKDAALERRFQPVSIGEPSKEETLHILEGLRDRYEAHHKVRITDEALYAAVDLSDRYISDRFLPDKAIDLMDEAASRVRIKSLVAPPDVKELESKLAALRKEKEEAIANQNFERAASIRDDERAVLDTMQRLQEEWEERSRRSEVTDEDIANIVSSWTSIPVTKLTEDESQRLLRLEDVLHERVIGQEEAVEAVSRAIRRSSAGLKDPRRPIGSFIFLGPTGVGKTELSKALAEALFGDENAMVRIDMSEYMEKHTVSRLVGSPPGYVGYDEGGQLTEKIRRHPYTVILFDEIEKAHPDVFNILLQVMEDGRLTDAKGRTVDFKNTVVIMTSNVGASEIGKRRRMGFGPDDDKGGFERTKEVLLEELKRTFKPEFLNRVDDIIVFHPLDEEHTRKIAGLMLQNVAKRLRERDIRIRVTDEVVDYLARVGFDPVYGARPLRRAIQQRVEDALSEELLAGSVNIGDSIVAYMDDGKLSFKKEEPALEEEKV
jgi:ATP-dependent Clp protease ATP-binding subunit ClpC